MFGTTIETFKGSKILISILALITLGVIFAFASENHTDSLDIIIFALIIIPAIFLIFWLWSVEIKIYNDGISSKTILCKKEMRWEDVSRLTYSATKQSINFIPVGTYYDMKLENMQGQKIRIGNRVNGMKSLSTHIINYTQAPLYNKIANQFNSGAELDFGAIKLNRNNGFKAKGLFRTIFDDFKTQILNSKFCHLKKIRFDSSNSPDYSNYAVQQLYLLRYFPAYLCEYKHLYGKILRDDPDIKLSVLSVGCGCCIDYYSLYLAKGRKVDDIKYLGIDPIPWAYIDNMNNNKFKFVNKHASAVKFAERVSFNVIFFPKSLSEIPENDFKTFLSNLSNCNFISKRIYLLSSIMDKGYGYDAARYKDVADMLCSKGFMCSKYEVPKEMKEKGALNKLDSQFDYPNDIKSFIVRLNECCLLYKKNKQNCKSDCKEQLNKQPILTSRYMSFQINCFEK